jgi:hypothetical protein
VKLARFRKPNATFFFSYVDIGLIPIQQYYKKEVTLRGGHIQEREGKRRNLRR